MCSPFPLLFIEDQMIEQVTSHKVLGVTIDNDVSWSEHITVLGKRLSQFSSVQNLYGRESPHPLHSVSQEFLQCCL